MFVKILVSRKRWEPQTEALGREMRMKEGDEKERRTERGKGKMRASGYCGDGFVKREWALERECAKRKKSTLLSTPLVVSTRKTRPQPRN